MYGCYMVSGGLVSETDIGDGKGLMAVISITGHRLRAEIAI